MACDTAFRIIARRHLDAVIAQHDAICRGDREALHQTRIALTHLRTAIRFFSSMVDDAICRDVRTDLRWLNRQLGLLRDLDVAIERIRVAGGKKPAPISDLQSWNEKREESQRVLARALSSARYRRLIERTSRWIESGPWSTRRGKDALKLRSCSLAEHAARQLAEWEKTLFKKSHRLKELSVEKQHQLRILNKRLTYSIESLEDLFSDKSLSKQRAALKQLRKAQRSLGELNDDARGRTLAKSLDGIGSEASFHFLRRKQQERLLRSAATAYKKLDKCKPFET